MSRNSQASFSSCAATAGRCPPGGPPTGLHLSVHKRRLKDALMAELADAQKALRRDNTMMEEILSEEHHMVTPSDLAKTIQRGGNGPAAILASRRPPQPCPFRQRIIDNSDVLILAKDAMSTAGPKARRVTAAATAGAAEGRWALDAADPYRSVRALPPLFNSPAAVGRASMGDGSHIRQAGPDASPILHSGSPLRRRIMPVAEASGANTTGGNTYANMKTIFGGAPTSRASRSDPPRRVAGHRPAEGELVILGPVHYATLLEEQARMTAAAEQTVPAYNHLVRTALRQQALQGRLGGLDYDE